MLCMLLLEPGDGVLTEQYSYSHLVEHTLKLRGNHAVPVAMDALGVQPAALRAVLQVCAASRNVEASCSASACFVHCCQDGRRADDAGVSFTFVCHAHGIQGSACQAHRMFCRLTFLHTMPQATRAAGGRQPRVFYTVPTGQNPTGATSCHVSLSQTVNNPAIDQAATGSAYSIRTSQDPPPPTNAGSTVPVERKWEIYSICSEYGVVIIEDDPYYYLQYPDATGAATCMTPMQCAWPCRFLCSCSCSL